ncbi:lipopolysaccharide-induced tumor necrosis factor-alpha factor homolog [Scleropages formosus]|uniref:lipopolysaccharide-induced tumor necrosis factor-alpha factor homolog n=1 Tax=Scleropages formosus TaxID=113540 RepID=UPI0008781B5F|nr:lipopolysaccharide-induced tumor necrosis factor-alpha factor homolog [Scleropages formosus]
MSSPSGTSELEKIEEDLRHVAAQIQQLRDRQSILEMLEEFRKSSPQSIKAAAEQQAEMESIQKTLRELLEKQEQLQKQSDGTLFPKTKREEIQRIISKGGVAVLPPQYGFDVVAPPPVPAPQIITDLENLPACPTHTVCPSCQQYIITETVSRVGGITWMVCIMCILIGCVAGCFLLPFCMKSFKDTVHRCPKCRSEIHTTRKL